jgi:hypothetical protein
MLICIVSLPRAENDTALAFDVAPPAEFTVGVARMFTGSVNVCHTAAPAEEYKDRLNGAE